MKRYNWLLINFFFRFIIFSGYLGHRKMPFPAVSKCFEDKEFLNLSYRVMQGFGHNGCLINAALISF